MEHRNQNPGGAGKELRPHREHPLCTSVSSVVNVRLLAERRAPGLRRLAAFALATAALLLDGQLDSAEVGQAGAARVDITPEGPIRLSGYGGRTAPSEGVEDRIFARTLALKDPDGVLTVFIVVDSVGVPEWVRQDVLDDLRERFAVYHTRLSLSSTHTHSGPCLARSIPNLLAMTPDEESTVRGYSKTLVKKLIMAVEEALGRLAPATIEWARGTAGFARNRRVGADASGGPADRELPVLAVRDASGKPLAVLFNYACHATTLGGEFNRVCPDWPGLAAALIEETHAGAVALPLIGCGADANPHPRGTLDHARAHAREIAAEVERLLRGPMTPLGPRIDAQLEYVTLPFASLPTEKELEATALLAKVPAHVRRNAQRWLDHIRGGNKLPAGVNYPIQVFAFGGELTMVLLAGEVVVDYSLRLKRELAPRALWITAYTNDVPCYIPSRRILAEGGYEADDSMVWYGQPAKFDPAVEEIIVEKVKALAGDKADAAALARRVKPPPAKELDDAIASFRLAKGFRIKPAAVEPDVTDPVAIAFDERERMYVVEMRDYPLGPGPGKPPDGRVRLLEDTNGFYDRSTIFADHVPYPNGVACWKDGVFVTAVPDILYLKDTDGDGKADERRTVFTGFEMGNAQHIVNTLQWGIDNWIYLNGGDSASVRRPDRPDLPPVKLEYTSARFRPDTLELEPTSGYYGGYGIAFDDAGNRFICDNQKHALHVVLEREFLANNPDLKVEETVANIATDPERRVYPSSRPIERFNDPWDAGRFTAACGVHIFKVHDFRGGVTDWHISCDPVQNIVHCELLKPSGATFRAERPPSELTSEFLASTDNWFRPVSCTTGPDGSLYIADMYREVIEHPQWIPVHMQKLFDLRSGMDRGRIWRVEYGEDEKRMGEPLASASSTQELVQYLGLGARWWRLTAQRLLIERRDPAAPALLSALMKNVDSNARRARLHALWTLEGLGELDRPTLSAALEDPDPTVRRTAVLLTGRKIKAAPESDPTLNALGRKLAEHAADADARVRFQAALSLHALPPEERIAPLIRIALADAGDAWTETAVLSSLDIDPTPAIEAILKRGEPTKKHRRLLERLSALTGARGKPSETSKALTLLLATDQLVDGDSRVGPVTALLGELKPGQLREILAAAGADGAAARSRLEALFGLMAKRALDESLPIAERVTSVDFLGRGGLESLATPLKEILLGPRHPADLQRRAAAALARLTESAARGEMASFFVSNLAIWTPPVRAEVFDVLLGDSTGAVMLLSAIERGEVRAGEIDLARRKKLIENLDEKLRARAEKVFGDLAASPDRAAVVATYEKALSGGKLDRGDPHAGEPLFLKHCSTCHKAGERGSAVGADLAGMRGRTAEALLTDILDPSRAVAPEFLNYTVVTRDKKILTGILASQTPTTVTLRAAEGKTDSVLRRDIGELRSTNQSLMPEGLEKELDPEALGNVIAFIRAGLGAVAAPSPSPAEPSREVLRNSLAFHAPFDGEPKAAVARGDPRIYTAPKMALKDPKEGLTSGNVAIAKGRGRFGDALEFRKKEEPAVFFLGAENMPYAKENWGGTVSLWMTLDPDQDLEPGFADPIQITEREWNDGAFFVDFSKDDKPRHFRLGVFADRIVWDPKKREWDDVPVAERPMVDVGRKIFGRGKWTHVAFTFSRFNTGQNDGRARLYIDGESMGNLSARRQTFTWDPKKTVIWLGLSYIGLMDDLAIFDRELTSDEVKSLYKLESGVKSLGR